MEINLFCTETSSLLEVQLPVIWKLSDEKREFDGVVSQFPVNNNNWRTYPRIKLPVTLLVVSNLTPSLFMLDSRRQINDGTFWKEFGCIKKV